MSDFALSMAWIAGALVAGVVLDLVVRFLARRLDMVLRSADLEIILKQLRGPLHFLIPALCVMAVLPLVSLRDAARTVLGYAVNLWVIASIGTLLLKISAAVRDIILSRFDISVRDNLEARRVTTQMRVIQRMIAAAIIVLTLAFMLMVFPRIRQIGVSLLASAGILGIVLGFAAQKTLGNFIAGIQIALAQPIRIDDVVIVEGEWGWIEEIALTYVVVRIWDLRRLVVPISYFVEKPFQNWTRVSADILGSVFLYADYTVPVAALREELTRLLTQNPRWDRKVNVLQVTELKERTVELRALMSAADSPTAWDLRCEVREGLLRFLQEKYPQALPRTRVELDRDGAAPPRT
ncbi:MAG: mechanosensitive ion channel family protein [Deltaproteobacteria bacterium]